jgi:hypothetical protein
LIYSNVDDTVQEQEYLFTNLHLRIFLTDCPIVFKMGENKFMNKVLLLISDIFPLFSFDFLTEIRGIVGIPCLPLPVMPTDTCLRNYTLS